MDVEARLSRTEWRPPPPMCQFQVFLIGEPERSDIAARAAEFGLWADLGGFGPDGGCPPPPEIWPMVGAGPSIADAVARARHLVMLDIADPGPDRLAQVLAATRLASDLAADFDGVVFDVGALRHFHPGGWRSPLAKTDTSIVNHVGIRISAARTTGRFHAATVGLGKFGRPEFQVRRLRPKLVTVAAELLLDLGQYVAEGALVVPGDTVGDPDLQLRAVEDTSAVPLPLPLPALRLVDAETHRSATRGLRAWARTNGVS